MPVCETIKKKKKRRKKEEKKKKNEIESQLQKLSEQYSPGNITSSVSSICSKSSLSICSKKFTFDIIML
jgi:hypothetical protein